MTDVYCSQLCSYRDLKKPKSKCELSEIELAKTKECLMCSVVED